MFFGAVPGGERSTTGCRARSGERDLIVTCQECSTSFQLDDARIPASGARVRCSRCKHAFFLANPSASQSQAIESVVNEAIQGKDGRSPDAARDLVGAAGAEPDEDDWQFSEEIRVAGDEPDEADHARTSSPHPDSFDLTGDFGRGFDPDTLSREAPARPIPTPIASSADSATKPTRAKPAAAQAPAAVVAVPVKASVLEPKCDEPRREGSSFGSIDDFSSLIEDENLSIDLATGSVQEARRNVPRFEAAAAPGVSPAADDLGDPESWDIVGGDGARQAKSAVAALVRPPVAGPKAKTKKALDQAPLDLFADTDLPPIHDDQDESPATYQRFVGIGKLVGWCISALCIAVAGSALMRPEWSRWSEAQQRVELGPVIAETTRSGWLETSRAGFLFVVEGELRNTGSQPVAAVPVQLALLDRSGARLAAPPIRAGQPLAELALRESRPEELSSHLDRSISGWLATPLAPGEVRRFTAISRAEELPATARRVLLEAGRPAKP